MREIDIMAAEAAADDQKLEDFVLKHEGFVLKCAADATGRYMTKSDDEWSVAQYALIEALRSYDLEKGSFYSYAALVIRRKLIDYYRGQQKYRPEQAVDPAVFSADPVDAESFDYTAYRIAESLTAADEGEALRLEIETVNAVFRTYGFSFYELAACSPKSEKTRRSCAAAVGYLLEHPLLIHQLRTSKKLLIDTIAKNCRIHRKILERHRKYIIAAVEILYGDYPYLAEYLKYIREETGQ